MKKLRELVGTVTAGLAVFAFVTEFILVFPAGPGIALNWLALSVYITLVVGALGLLMASD